MTKWFMAFLAISALILHLDSYAEEKTAEKGPEKGKESSSKEASVVKEAATKEAPRTPASAPEILSDDTVEYVKQAGKRIEDAFERVNRR